MGAGPAGLVTARALQRLGLVFDVLERTGEVGGLWRAAGPPTAAYAGLSANSSRATMAFSELPLPPGPAFTSRRELGAYFRRYAERFALEQHVHFDADVTGVAPIPEGGFEVAVAGAAPRRYDAVVVCNGHHDVPRRPDPLPPGPFDGEELHSRDYAGPADYAGRTVLVVGLGNTAVDVVVGVSHVAERTLLSTRRGVHLFPDLLFGRPPDRFERELRLPGPLRAHAMGLLLRAAMRLRMGRAGALGLPRPPRRLGADPGTLSGELPSRLARGAVEPRGAVVERLGDRVRFADGQIDAVDVIIWCTGYVPALPFLPDALLGPGGGPPPRYLELFPPGTPGLSFVGLVQSTGPPLLVLEAQAQLVAAHLAGRCPLPSPAEMTAAIARTEDERRRRWRPGPRTEHAVDSGVYLATLARELRAGSAA